MLLLLLRKVLPTEHKRHLRYATRLACGGGGTNYRRHLCDATCTYGRGKRHWPQVTSMGLLAKLHINRELSWTYQRSVTRKKKKETTHWYVPKRKKRNVFGRSSFQPYPPTNIYRRKFTFIQMAAIFSMAVRLNGPALTKRLKPFYFESDPSPINYFMYNVQKCGFSLVSGRIRYNRTIEYFGVIKEK